jgi:acyl-CoA thioester hydrolase
MRISTHIQIRFNDMDMAGHAHNAVYLSWLEQARMELLGTFIDKEHDWKAQGLILARNEVDYRLPVHLNDSIAVECWCSAIGNKSFDLRYEVIGLLGAQRTLHAERHGLLRLHTQHPDPIAGCMACGSGTNDGNR